MWHCYINMFICFMFLKLTEKDILKELNSISEFTIFNSDSVYDSVAEN